MLVCEYLWNSETARFPLRFTGIHVYKAVISVLKRTDHAASIERAFLAKRAAAPEKAKAGTKVKKESEKTSAEQLAWLKEYALLPFAKRKLDLAWFHAHKTEFDDRFSTYSDVCLGPDLFVGGF